MVSGNAIFEGGLKFATSKARKNFYRTDSEDLVEIGEQPGSNF